MGIAGFDSYFVALTPVDTADFGQRRETSCRLDIHNSDQHLVASSRLDWDIADFDSQVETIDFDPYPVALNPEDTVGAVDPFRVVGMAEDSVLVGLATLIQQDIVDFDPYHNAAVH